jgi:hypothetical protein
MLWYPTIPKSWAFRQDYEFAGGPYGKPSSKSGNGDGNRDERILSLAIFRKLLLCRPGAAFRPGNLHPCLNSSPAGSR